MDNSEDDIDFKHLKPEHLLLKAIATTDSEKYQKLFSKTNFKSMEDMNQFITESIKNEQLSVISEQIENLDNILSHTQIKSHKKRKNKKKKNIKMENISASMIVNHEISIIDEVNSHIEEVKSFIPEAESIISNIESIINQDTPMSILNEVSSNIVDNIESTINQEISSVLPDVIPDNISNVIPEITQMEQVIQSMSECVVSDTKIHIIRQQAVEAVQNFNQIVNTIETIDRITENIENTIRNQEEVKVKVNCLFYFLSIFLKKKEKSETKMTNVSI